MPEHTELSCLFIFVTERIYSIVNSEILVVLSDDLGDSAFVTAEENEVFDIVKQTFFAQKSMDKVFDAGSGLPDGFPIGIFRF